MESPRGVRIAAILAVGLLAAGAVGCKGRDYVYFRPARDPQGAPRDWVARGETQLPPESGAVELNVAARGVIEEEEGRVPEESVEVRMHVANRGPETFVLDPADARLIDDEGVEGTGAWVEKGDEKGGPIVVGPGEKARYTLRLDLPPGTRFENIGSFRVRWPYRYGADSHTAETKFIKIEEVEYYYPYDRHYYYYDPWYYPYHPHYYHRPWYGRWHFGLGYTYHHH